MSEMSSPDDSLSPESDPDSSSPAVGGAVHVWLTRTRGHTQHHRPLLLRDLQDPEFAGFRSLLEAYAATHFEADLPIGTVVLKVGSAAPAVDTLLDRDGAEAWTYITAYNPASEWLSPEQNAERQQSLKAELDAQGLTCFPGRGADPSGHWPAEPSLLVLGLSGAAAVSLARRYGQNAIVGGRRGGPAQLYYCGALPPTLRTIE